MWLLYFADRAPLLFELVATILLYLNRMNRLFQKCQQPSLFVLSPQNPSTNRRRPSVRLFLQYGVVTDEYALSLAEAPNG
mmetsp:Transcript_11649/g.33090  ORF Transcript_11649/g.33090 Transcript_11649/m.33090 type:complete len:80 (-) Transcript_11649:1028-1267(-)